MKEALLLPVQCNYVVKEGGNFLAVEVDNTRTADAIPALSFDWWNYGGITRDVMLVHTPKNYIRDYFIQLDKYDSDRVHAEVQLSAQNAGQLVKIEIPELKIANKVLLMELVWLRLLFGFGIWNAGLLRLLNYTR